MYNSSDEKIECNYMIIIMTYLMIDHGRAR